MCKKVAYFTNSKTLFTNNTVLGVFREFIAQGIEIHLFCPNGNVKLPNDLSEIKKYQLPNALVFWPKNPFNIISALIDYFNLIWHFHFNKINTVIGQDHFGLIIAGRIAKIFNCQKVAYFSFEIYFKNELSTIWDLKIKNKELKYCNLVTDILIQDIVRMDLLKVENNISDNVKWHLIPVAPTSTFFYEHKNNTYLKQRLSIPLRYKITVHSGSVEKWSGAQLFIDALKNDWPRDFWLVIHSFEEFSGANKIHVELKKLQELGHNITLYHHIFKNDNQYFDFLSCFDIGFALYVKQSQNGLGKNVEEIGLASGKFSNLMMLGIPTIVTNNTYYPELFANYKAGEVIKEYSQIKTALIKIVDADQDNYGKQAKKLYEQVLNPRKAIHEMTKLLFIK